MRKLARRLTVPGLFAGLAAFGPGAAVPAGEAPARHGEWLLVYVGAEDCAPCRAWRESRWDGVRATHRSAALRFVELRARRSAEALDDSLWPESLRPQRDAIPPGAGLPLWLLSRDGRVEVRAWGASQWDTVITPALRRVPRGAAASEPTGS